MELCVIQEWILMENLVRKAKQDLIASNQSWPNPYSKGDTSIGPSYYQYDYIERFLITHYPDLNFKLKRVHGELNHTLDFPSCVWGIKHSIVELQFNHSIYYIDLTSCQFSELGLPKVYYSKIYPKWHLPDLNNHVIRLIRFTDKHRISRDNVLVKFVDWLEYDVRGFFSDIIRKILKRT